MHLNEDLVILDKIFEKEFNLNLIDLMYLIISFI